MAEEEEKKKKKKRLCPVDHNVWRSAQSLDPPILRMQKPPVNRSRANGPSLQLHSL
jgi:hypothetical protein